MFESTSSMENPERDLARQIIENTNTNLFLTGRAGTGKTTFLRQIREEVHKRMVVLAPTGIAAINAGGVTIHSFLQLPFAPFIPGMQFRTDQFRMPDRKKRLIRSLDLIVIDEISMVRADLLDSVDAALRRYRDPMRPFGGVQLLLIGDLQQLSPVVKDEDRELLSRYYDSEYFFSSHALQKTPFVTVELQTVYRQSDDDFLHLLNAVRNSTIDAELLARLNARYIPDFRPPEGEAYVRLVTHNHQADAINRAEMTALTTPAFTYDAEVKDKFPESSYPAAERLTLKRGAQVMFIRNGTAGEDHYFNGMLGEVVSLEHDEITVRTNEGGVLINVPRETWNNARYVLDERTNEIQEVIDGTFTQYPLRPAWAITIHKSQGLTFERAIIDVQALSPTVKRMWPSRVANRSKVSCSVPPFRRPPSSKTAPCFVSPSISPNSSPRPTNCGKCSATISSLSCASSSLLPISNAATSPCSGCSKSISTRKPPSRSKTSANSSFSSASRLQMSP